MKDAALIFNIKGNSLDDGPGIRSVVFFKGCPLACVWCHNPESRRPAPELSFDAQQCVACDTCLQVCKDAALSRDNPFFIDRARCSRCFACAQSCPSGALSVVGREYTVEQVVKKVARDKPFYDSSGGGVTFSGGEPTLHLDFLAALVSALHGRGIHTLIETCGLFDFDRFREAVLPHTDMIYMDLKLFDPEEHRRLCGVDNRKILENFARLQELSRAGQFTLLPRVPLIPGITDSRENLEAIAGFLKQHGAREVRLLPNNPTWHDKCPTIGDQSPFDSQSPLRQWLPAEKLEECREVFTSRSILVS